MPIDEVNEYYLNRGRESLAMSKAATEPGIRKIHLELARLYAARVDAPDDSGAIRPTLTLFKKNEL